MLEAVIFAQVLHQTCIAISYTWTDCSICPASLFFTQGRPSAQKQTSMSC